MKIDISQEFENADGSPAIDAKTNKPIALKSVLINALLQDGGPSTSQEEKMRRYALFMDLKKTEVGFVTWNSEDAAFAKKAVASAYPTLVVGQAFAMIEASAS
jgi:hypothetical protein